MIQEYREHNVSDKEFEAVCSELSESEFEEAKIKIAKELGGDVFADFFLLAMDGSVPKAIVPPGAEYLQERERLSWWQSLGEIECRTSDGCPVKLDLAFGYKLGDDSMATELQDNSVVMRQYIICYVGSLSREDLRPQKEGEFKRALCDGINDNILSVGRVRDIRAMKLDVEY